MMHYYGTDRSIPSVCKLLNKPRTKKEAKTYYRIETEEVTYQTESEDSVSETEIQNILTHYKKLGKDTERYVESFDNIAAQYTDGQLRVISTFLPIGVRAVLEAQSPKYQSIMTFGEGTYNKKDEKKPKEEKKHDLKIGFIETNNDKTRPTKPVVIPSAVKVDGARKLFKKDALEEKKDIIEEEIESTNTDDIDSMFEDILPNENEKQEEIQKEKIKVTPKKENKVKLIEESEVIEEQESNEAVENVTSEIEELKEKLNEENESEKTTTKQEENIVTEEPIKKKRGRPRKVVEPGTEEVKVPKKRGRPKKVVEPEIVENAQVDTVLPGIDRNENKEEKMVLPGLEEETAPNEVNLFELADETEKYIENTNQDTKKYDLSRFTYKGQKDCIFCWFTKKWNFIFDK